MSWQWLTSDHPGSAELLGGASCSSCHTGQLAPSAAELGERLVAHPELEPEPIEGKQPSLDMSVRADYDDTDLYLRFEWTSASEDLGIYNDYFRFDGEEWQRVNDERPDGVEADLAQEDRLSVMIDDRNLRAFDGAEVGFGEVGCFAACHSDNNEMPLSPSRDEVRAHPYLGDEGIGEQRIRADRVRKYLLLSRFEFDETGAWDKVKEVEELDALIADGDFLDLWQWRGNRGIHGWGDDGWVFEYRHQDPGVRPYRTSSDGPELMFNDEVYGYNAFKWEELRNEGTPFYMYEGDEEMWLPFDPDLAWEEGDTLPRRIQQDPEGSGAVIMAYAQVERDRWVLELKRPLETSDDNTDKRFEDGGVYHLGLSLHDDHSGGRRHYVSFPLSLGLGVDADVTATRLE